MKNTVINPKGKHPQIREDYTFENYVIGDNNDFAVKAAITISKNPGKFYNPFFIFGSVGLGKTHLIQAIGNSIYQNTDYKVIYTTSENFLNEYVQSVMDNKMNAFKNNFRNTDVLLFDDIQFLQNKPRVQEEVFHTFNHLLNSEKHIIFFCNRQLAELEIDERLRSRLALCTQVELQPPGYKERRAILLSIAEKRNIKIPDEVIDYIVNNTSTKTRDFIGFLNTLIAYVELMEKPITKDITIRVLENIAKNNDLQNY